MAFLVERDYESVSGIWTGCHVFLFAACVAFSMASAIIFHMLVIDFNSNCILNPKSVVVLSNLTLSTESKRINLPIDFIKSQWAQMDDCVEALYNPILSVIFGAVWFTLFIMCSDGGRAIAGLRQPWRIVLPCFIFSFVYSIVCIVITKDLNNGLNNFHEHLSNITSVEDENVKMEYMKTEIYIIITIVSSWIYTSSWIASFVFLILRCLAMPDFKVMKITVETGKVLRGQNLIGEDTKIKGTYQPLKRDEQIASPILECDEPSTSSTVTTTNVVIEPVRTKDYY